MKLNLRYLFTITIFICLPLSGIAAERHDHIAEAKKANGSLLIFNIMVLHELRQFALEKKLMDEKSLDLKFMNILTSRKQAIDTGTPTIDVDQIILREMCCAFIALQRWENKEQAKIAETIQHTQQARRHALNDYLQECFNDEAKQKISGLLDLLTRSISRKLNILTSLCY